jgi:hypothetical protein
MRNTFTVNFSTIAFVAAVHAIGGIGLGMWLSDRVPAGRRRTAALALMALGAILHRADATGSAARETRRRKDAQQTLAARTRK